jgi:hypothetical protein
MDYRMIINEVRAALEEKAAREMYGGTAATTAEQEIANRVMLEVLPGLRGMLAMLNELQEVWLAPGNEIQGKIAKAAEGGAPLAGYAPSAWLAWGAVLTALQMFLGTEIEFALPDGSTAKITPKNVLLTRYIQTPTQEANG